MFFKQNSFIHVHIPIAIESTKSTNIYGKGEKTIAGIDQMKGGRDINIEVIKAAIKQKKTQLEELERSDSNKEVLINALKDLQKASELALQMEKQNKENRLFRTCTSDFPELYLESYACALSNVYTFGPIFQARKYVDSNENLEEKWTVEAALAFAELQVISFNLKCIVP